MMSREEMGGRSRLNQAGLLECFYYKLHQKINFYAASRVNLSSHAHRSD